MSIVRAAAAAEHAEVEFFAAPAIPTQTLRGPYRRPGHQFAGRSREPFALMPMWRRMAFAANLVRNASAVMCAHN